MSALEHFEIENDHAVFRPVGMVTLKEAVQLVISAITFAREQGNRTLLANLTLLTGFPSPSLIARYQFVKEWAQASCGSVRLAVVVLPEMLDPGRFGVIVARHHGLVGDAFTLEPDAMAWLRGLG